MITDADDSWGVARAIGRKIQAAGEVARFPTGSVPVFAVKDEYVIKLFPEREASHFESERAALRRIEGRLSIPTPLLIDAGRREHWLYIVMTRLRGQSLAEAWPSIDADCRRRLMRDLGSALAQLHALETDGLAPLSVDWTRFVEAQRASCRERQAGKGLPSPWLDQVDAFLQRWMPLDDGRRALLHTEVMREHLLVEPAAESWRLSGLFDFEPAMVGAPEYELASVGIFVTCAQPGLLRLVLDAYGMLVDTDLPLRIMAYTLLHRYSNLRWYLDRLPVPSDARSLEDIARSWFAP